MTTRFGRFVGARSAAVAAMACVPLALAGCGGANSENAAATVAATTTATTTTTTATTTAAQTSTACSFGGATTAPGDTALSRMTVTGVRTGQQDCFDRVVIDLAGDASTKPGYQARYVAQVRQDGSGKPVVLRGGAFLTLVVGAPAYDAAGQPTYLPANTAEVANVTGYTSLRQVAWAGSFEGMTTLGIGVREQLPFKVSIVEEAGKTRLVLDVAHNAT